MADAVYEQSVMTLKDMCRPSPALSSHTAAAYMPLEFGVPIARHHSKDRLSKGCF